MAYFGSMRIASANSASALSGAPFSRKPIPRLNAAVASALSPPRAGRGRSSKKTARGRGRMVAPQTSFGAAGRHLGTPSLLYANDASAARKNGAAAAAHARARRSRAECFALFPGHPGDPAGQTRLEMLAAGGLAPP